jgi:5'-AMP-activated protein kinase catalytic alpha subunit
MLCGYLPFDEDSKSLLYKKILACEYTIPRFVSQEAQDLLKRILVRNIHQIKTHPWFNQIKKKLPIGYISLKDKIPISRPLSPDDSICLLTAIKMKVSEQSVKQMIEENSHNKYTTL